MPFGMTFSYVHTYSDDDKEKTLLQAQRAAAIAVFQRTHAFDVAMYISEVDAKLRSLGISDYC